MLWVAMKTFLALSLVILGVHGVAAVTHSMTYIVTAARGVHGFPEHNEVGLVDGQVFVHYDSNLKKVIPKTDWIEKNVDADYWERETQRNINNEQVFKGNINTAMGRFNQTSGAHIVQWMYGCEWDDETGDVSGFHNEGYDGEDYIVFDLKTETWIAPKQQAFATKHKWNNDKAWIAQTKNYLTQICVEWLKKYLHYGRSSLMRTELPSVSLLQKTPSSPVRCHATGFYPERVTMFWRKDGEELHENVERGEILPNHDGSFQMKVDLNVSSVTPEDWRRYECVFQLSGVKDDIITKLDEMRKPGSDGGFPLGAVVGVGVVLLLLVVGIAGFFLWKKSKKGKEGFKRASTSDTSGSSDSVAVPVPDGLQ